MMLAGIFFLYNAELSLAPLNKHYKSSSEPVFFSQVKLYFWTWTKFN